ncbi:hypothetical protein [Dolichospermum sp. UHCC 0259]|nr:hypothetical protein [Dolichospermum sp. UHCC 0259]
MIILTDFQENFIKSNIGRSQESGVRSQERRRREGRRREGSRGAVPAPKS